MASIVKTTENISSSNDLVPKIWPGAFKLYRYSKSSVMLNVWLLVGVFVVYYIVSLIFSQILRHSFLNPVLSLIWNTVFTVSSTMILLAGTYGKSLTASQSYSKDLQLYVNVFIANILVLAACVLSILLLVIPFFFVFPRLILVTYYVIDKRMKPVDAFKASWANSKTHVSKIWGIIGVNLLITLTFVTIIGIPFAIYFFVMYSAAIAILYRMIENKTV
jgi:hypothetical protein